MVPLEPTNYTITTYTDGSKHKDDSTGYGVVIFMNSATLMTENITLDHHHTVFQCEAHALHRASILLNDILSSPSLSEHRVIIYSDSQALIKALSNSYSISKTIINLHKSLNETASTHSIMIEWVPGHKDHYGNELADKLANIRVVKPNPALSTNHPSIPHTFFKNKVHKYINDKKMKLWNNSNISQNTKSLVSAIVNHNLQGQHLFKLGFDVLKPLTRLITGHNNLNHFQNKIDFTTAPHCSFCEGDVHESAMHLICDCEYFARTRMEKFGKDPITMDQLMRFISLTKNMDLTVLLDFIGDRDL